MTPTTEHDARAAAKGLRERIQVAGLFAGDAMALLKDLWRCYREEAGAADRLAEMLLFRECPYCEGDLEAAADRIVASRATRR
jgi:hypothetical protein